MPGENIHQLLNDPLAQELLTSKIPVRLAYTGLAGWKSAGDPHLVSLERRAVHHRHLAQCAKGASAGKKPKGGLDH